MHQELSVLEDIKSVTVFSPETMNELLARIGEEARAHVPDLSTAKGRSEIASMANKVARSKTYLDGLGKTLTADLKKQTGAIDASRRSMREALDALKAEVREPLTKWEQVEKDRVADLQARLEGITFEPTTMDMDAYDKAEFLSRTIAEIEAVEVDESWAEFEARAIKARDVSLRLLRAELLSAQDEIKKLEEFAAREEERKETVRIAREAEIARLAVEAERNAAKEREAQAQAAREAAEIQAKQAQKAEANRIERERLDAEQARIAAEQRAIKAEREAKEQAKAAVEREQARVAAEQARVAAEQEKREADKQHKATINRQILADLEKHKVPADLGKAIIRAVASGRIDNLIITY